MIDTRSLTNELPWQSRDLPEPRLTLATTSCWQCLDAAHPRNTCISLFPISFPLINKYKTHVMLKYVQIVFNREYGEYLSDQ